MVSAVHIVLFDLLWLFFPQFSCSQLAPQSIPSVFPRVSQPINIREMQWCTVSQALSGLHESMSEVGEPPVLTKTCMQTDKFAEL